MPLLSHLVSFGHVSLHSMLLITEIGKEDSEQLCAWHVPHKVNLSINLWAREMVHLVKAFASKPDDLSLIPRIHVV